MYNLTEAAASDIEAILEKSLIAFGVLQTEHYYTALTQCLELLADNPEMGTTAEDIRPGYRRFPHESHVIFYTPDTESVCSLCGFCINTWMRPEFLRNKPSPTGLLRQYPDRSAGSASVRYGVD